ncbi:MAG TPA: substrate-binding domain-containing protein [Pseudomonadales bacterium]|nr:substrate-binding domain-containing protein [Pseudomonadales bacterium]
MKKILVLAAVMAVSAPGAIQAQGRDTINIVGSSTVYPFATVVAERYGKMSGKTPKVESIGTGGGMKLFCGGDGIDTPDITNASRRIKQSELDKCFENGAKQIVEIKIGYDGIAVANSKQSPLMKVTREQIYEALAKQLPAKNGDEKMVDNPNKLWSDIDKSLPAVKIEVIGPPPTSGTRDSFVELVMEDSCKQYAWLGNMEKIDKDDFKKKCDSIREDGAYIEAGENDNLIVQKLVANKNAFGIFGYSFLEENADKVQGSQIDGKTPTFETISSGDYKISRPLYFYVKKTHIASLPGIQQYMAEFTSEAAWGDEGYLAGKGMIPMKKSEREQFAADAKALKILPEKI